MDIQINPPLVALWKCTNTILCPLDFVKISVWLEFPEELIDFCIKLILLVKIKMLRTEIKLCGNNSKNIKKRKEREIKIKKQLCTL